MEIARGIILHLSVMGFVGSAPSDQLSSDHLLVIQALSAPDIEPVFPTA